MQNITLYDQVRKDMERVANNCRFYQEQGNQIHLINEVGCLRGQMYIADMIGIPYPKVEYYNAWIKPIYDTMNG